VISSPAGDRGRASNYVYGAAKAAVTVLAAGLRHRLAAKGVRVRDILPGFVDTPMTAAFAKGPLWASPEQGGGDIERASTRASAPSTRRGSGAGSC
jgi:decaprenylphospho-beta-D-erythro-pentofuranosid-2-ulose 2-reductase